MNTSCFFILEAVVCPEDSGQVNSVPAKFNTVPHSLAWTAAGAVVQQTDPPPAMLAFLMDAGLRPARSTDDVAL